MEPANYLKLIKLLLPLPVEDLIEVQRWITHIVGIVRAGQVLKGEQKRPGKRGKRRQTKRKED